MTFYATVSLGKTMEADYGMTELMQPCAAYLQSCHLKLLLQRHRLALPSVLRVFAVSQSPIVWIPPKTKKTNCNNPVILFFSTSVTQLISKKLSTN